jgi:hypothetical protein
MVVGCVNVLLMDLFLVSNPLNGLISVLYGPRDYNIIFSILKLILHCSSPFIVLLNFIDARIENSWMRSHFL